MKKIIGIDSNVFIWGIREKSSIGQESKIEEAKNFFKLAASKEWLFLLPTPMLAEILSPVPKEERQSILSLIDKRFIIAPFDVPAANKCAELLYKSYTDKEIVEYRVNNAVPKQKMKYDCMIAAICIVRKIGEIYTDDGDIEKFADGQLVVKKLPKIAMPITQTDLFGNRTQII